MSGVRPFRRRGGRLLVYSQDGLGLGHLRRSFAIAAEVIARDPDCAALVISDAPAPPFSPPAGVDYLKLPTVVKEGDALRWRAGSLALDVKEILKLRARIMLDVLRQFRPDTVLVDHMPVGALGELKPLLDRAISRAPRPRLFLGLRDVLDTPDVIRLAWGELGAYDYLPYYEAILVYGSREIYDAGRLYDLTRHAQRLVYCNYATSRSGAASIQSERDPQLIVVTGGGGADAFPLERAFLEALPILHKAAPMRALILTGPYMPWAERAELTARAASHQVGVVSVDDATAWFRRASAVVTMAGYNSLCEALKTKTRALVVPRRGPSAEQRIRARVFSERGLVVALEPDELTPDRLARDLLRLLAEGGIPNAATIPRMDGAHRAAELLSEEWPVDLGRRAGTAARRAKATREELAGAAATD